MCVFDSAQPGKIQKFIIKLTPPSKEKKNAKKYNKIVYNCTGPVLRGVRAWGRLGGPNLPAHLTKSKI